VRTLQTVAYICVGYFVNCTCSQVHILVCAHICTYVGKYTHACTALSSHYCTNIHVLCMHKHTLLHCLNMHLHVHACCSLSNMSFNTRVCIFTWPTCIFSVQTCSSACIRAFECAFMIFTSLIWLHDIHPSNHCLPLFELPHTHMHLNIQSWFSPC